MINKSQQPKQYKVLPASHGFNWVKDATQLLRGNFTRWLVLVLLYLVLFFSSFIHELTFLSFIILNQVMWGGIFLAGTSTVARLEWTPSILFEPLKKNARALIRLGIVLALVNSLIAIFFYSHLGTLMDMEQLEKIRLEMNKTQDMEPFLVFFSDPVLVQEIMLAFLIALLISVPIAMAGWFAPVLIIEKRLTIPQALITSFQACTSNFMAFLIYGLIGFILLFFVLKTAFIGILFVGPLFFASYYCSYIDIFPEASQNDQEEDESNSTFVV